MGGGGGVTRDLSMEDTNLSTVVKSTCVCSYVYVCVVGVICFATSMVTTRSSVQSAGC